MSKHLITESQALILGIDERWLVEQPTEDENHLISARSAMCTHVFRRLTRTPPAPQGDRLLAGADRNAVHAVATGNTEHQKPRPDAPPHLPGRDEAPLLCPKAEGSSTMD